jgi:outer membrane biosynthesis protein TonB
MDHDGPDDPTQADDAGGPHEFDRIRTSPVAGVQRRLGVSVPGAIGGVLLIGALAFGSNLGPRYEPDRVADAGRSDTAVVETEPTEAPDGEPEADKPAAGPGETEPEDVPGVDEPASEPDAKEPTDAPDADPTEKPEPDATPKATERPEPKPTERPEPKPTPKPTEKPEPAPTAKPVLSLTLAVKEGAIFIDWGTCNVDGADVYKVVRSTDSTVKWPAGDGDELIAATEVGGSTKAWDEHAAPGKKAWYRVFCVRKTEDGYKVLAASATKSIVAPADKPEPTPKPTPAPEPADLAIEAGTDGGNVVVHWEACGGETFSHYRILRKAGDDAQVIAEIENAATTTYVDDGLEPGTYQYAVQCKGHVGDDWFLLGASGWATATVE